MAVPCTTEERVKEAAMTSADTAPSWMSCADTPLLLACCMTVLMTASRAIALMLLFREEREIER